MKSKDERLSKQLGDFGEQLVMFIIGRCYSHRVALVNHVGVDVIATDCEWEEKESKKYGISVKTRVFTKDDSSFDFDENQQEKLVEFSKGFGLTPMVAFVCVDSLENAEVNFDVYFIELEDFRRLAVDDTFKGISITGINKTNLRFSNAKSNQKYLQNHELINHHRLTLKSKDLKL